MKTVLKVIRGILVGIGSVMTVAFIFDIIAYGPKKTWNAMKSAYNLSGIFFG